MKTIDKLIERIKKEGRSIGNSIDKNVGKKLILPLTLTTLLTASAQEARADLKKVWQEIKDRTSIEASYSYSKPDLNKEYIDKLNDDIKTGKITVSPLVHNYLIEPAKSLSTYGGKIQVKVWEKKENELYGFLTAGYDQGTTNTSYSATEYTTLDTAKAKPVIINRSEKNKISKTSLGTKLKTKANKLPYLKELSDKVDVSATADIDFYKINGNANLTWNYPYTNYTQRRNASYSGNATGFSAELSANYKLGKNVSLGAGVGYRKAKVSTSGIENVTTSTGGKGHHDYNPTFNLNGVYGRAVFRLRF